MPTDGAMTALEALRQRAKLSKDRHFAASERKAHYQTAIGLPVVLINVFVGVVLVKFLQDNEQPAWASATAVGLAFLGASLSAVQTFFNFGKMSEGHRSVANRYLNVSSNAELLLLLHGDKASAIDDLWGQITGLQKLYHQINEDAEAFPTNAADLKRARKKTSLVPFDSPVEAGEGAGTT